ncbi:MAG: hypothetical protein ABW039_11495 [Sphingobium sp.]
MSVHPPPYGPTPVDGCSAAAGVQSLATVPAAHAVELAYIFGPSLDCRSEMLAAEARRHIAGCLLSVETALRLAVASDQPMAAAMAHLPDPLCWPALCIRPGLIGPSLLRHMQLRAAVSLILRQPGVPISDGAPDAIASDPFHHGDDGVIEALALLAIAEGRWAARGGEDQPMRADLPAEYFADLLWTAVAILAHAIAPALPGGVATALPVLTDAGRSILARHDESAGPLASADRLVSRLGAGTDDAGLVAQAIGQRRLLLFAALISRRLRVGSEATVELLLTAPIASLAALCKAVGASGVEFRHLLLTLRPARPALTDAAILTHADGFPDGEQDDGARVIAMLSAPPKLRAKIDQIGLWAPR